MRKYDVILFDLDGTLTASKPGIIHCIRLALDTYNVPYTDAQLDKMVGPPFVISMREILGVDDDELILKMIDVYRGQYEIDGWKECEIYDGIIDLLKDLNANGFRVALATSKPIKFSSIMINGLGLAPYFEFLGGSLSDSSNETKSDIINHALDNMKVTDKSRVLMVGDRLYDIVGAHKSGVDVAAVRWGYGDDEEFKRYGADYIVSTPSDLFALLTK